MRDGRVSASAWLLARSSLGAPSLAPSGQLGGSQAGVRVFWEPGPARLALTGRVSAPLTRSTGRELSAGLGYRGRHFGILAERRIGLGRGSRDAFMATAFAGTDDIRLPLDVRLGGYAQAGVVGLRRRDMFVDGAVELERPLWLVPGASLSAGAAAWGGAQPGLERLDIGPQLVTRLRLGDRSMRVSASWRHRVAGNARPASGPALAIGTDF